MAGSPEMTAYQTIQSLERDKELLARAFIKTWYCSTIDNLDEIERILQEMGLDMSEESLQDIDDAEEDERLTDGEIYAQGSEEEEPHFSLALVERLLSEDREEQKEVQEKGKK